MFEVRDLPGVGRGVVATAKIPRGALIMTLGGQVLSWRTLDRYQDQHCLRVGPGQYLGPSGGPDDFLNHSCDPSGELRGRWLFARRDIEPGQEITFDYEAAEGPRSSYTMECCCGTPCCRGVIGMKSLLERAVLSFIEAVEAHGPDPSSHTDFVSTVLEELPYLKGALEGFPDPRSRPFKQLSITMFDHWVEAAARPRVLVVLGFRVWEEVANNPGFTPRFRRAIQQEFDQGLVGTVQSCARDVVLLVPELTGVTMPGLYPENRVAILGFDHEPPNLDAQHFQEIFDGALDHGTVQQRFMTGPTYPDSR